MAYKRKIKHGYCLEVDEAEMDELKKILDYYCEKVDDNEIADELLRTVFDKFKR